VTKLRDCESIAPIEKIWEAVQKVSQSHWSNGFVDRRRAGWSQRQWTASHRSVRRDRGRPKVRFATLPYDLQHYPSDREKER
jgi:hypothetical protein